MKKLLLVLALLLSTGCANQIRWAKAKYNVSIDAVLEECVAKESYALPVFRESFMAFRYTECLGVVDMFAIAWKGIEHPELEDKLSDILMLEYLRLHNENNKDNQLGHVFVKHDIDEETGLEVKYWYFLNMADQ
jgi:hypothetical protein